LAPRSRIILLAADGMQDKQIAQRMGLYHAWRLFGEAGLSNRVSAV
jgi:DNA-binding NarL/FixJ family response regulator